MSTPRLISIDGQPLTVVQPREFTKTRQHPGQEEPVTVTRQGYYSRQQTVIDGKPVTVQVLIYGESETHQTTE